MYTRSIRNHHNQKLYRKAFRYLFQVLQNKDVRLSGNVSKLPYHFKIGREAVLLWLCKMVHFYTLTSNVRYFFSYGMKMQNEFTKVTIGLLKPLRICERPFSQSKTLSIYLKFYINLLLQISFPRGSCIIIPNFHRNLSTRKEST